MPTIWIYPPSPLIGPVDFQTRAKHVQAYVHAVWPAVVDPPDLTARLRIPLDVKSFDHIPAQPYTEQGLTGKRIRFARFGHIALMTGGESVCGVTSPHLPSTLH